MSSDKCYFGAMALYLIYAVLVCGLILKDSIKLNNLYSGKVVVLAGTILGAIFGCCNLA